MKNLIVNVFKTLFFFDLAILIFVRLPEVTASNAALLKLKQEAIIMGVPLVLTLVYFFLVEKRKLGVPINRHVFKSIGWGLFSGIVPIGVTVGALFILKKLKFTGIEKPEHIWFWLAAMLCNTIAAELLLRGYLFKLFKKHYGFMFSAIVTTMLFLSIDIKLFDEGKIYIANIILLNFLLCLILEYSGSIVSTIIARFFYTGISCYLFGSIQLTGGYPTLLKYSLSGKKLFTGGEYGLEGSLVTLIVLGLFAAVLLIYKYRPIKMIKEIIKDISRSIKRLKKRFKKKTKKAAAKS